MVEGEFKIRGPLLISPNSLTQGDGEAICRWILILLLLWLLVNEARQFIVAPLGVKNLMCKTHTKKKKKSLSSHSLTPGTSRLFTFASNEAGILNLKLSIM